MPQTIAEAYDVLLFDLDGVVYIGGKAIPGAPEALQGAQRAGAHVAYVTNNASRTPAAVAALLAGMDAPGPRSWWSARRRSAWLSGNAALFPC